MLLQVLCDSNVQTYTILYLKRQIKLTFSIKIQGKRGLKKCYLFFTFGNENLFKYLHLLISSDFLFFSLRHN